MNEEVESVNNIEHQNYVITQERNGEITVLANSYNNAIFVGGDYLSDYETYNLETVNNLLKDLQESNPDNEYRIMTENDFRQTLELQSNKNEEIMENTNNNEILITDEELNNCKKIIPVNQYQSALELMQGEEGNFYKQKLKDISDISKKITTDNELVNEDGTHNVGFHYFIGNTDIYISQLYPDGTAFGYTILNGDVEMAEWGYQNIEEIINSKQNIEIDYYVPNGMTIERMLQEKYPEYYKKENNEKIEQSENIKQVEENDIENIIPDEVQNQSLQNRNKALDNKSYINFLTEVLKNFEKVNRNNWTNDITENEKLALDKFYEWKNKNETELDSKTVENYTKTEEYSLQKDVIGRIYNKVYKPRQDRHNNKEKPFSYGKEYNKKDKEKKAKETPQKNNKQKNNKINTLIKDEDVSLFVKNYLKEKNLDLNLEQYTKAIFKLTKNLFKVPIEENIMLKEHPERVKALKPLFNEYKKTTNDEEKLKVFENYISNDKNKDNLEMLGNLYATTLKEKIKTLQIKKDEYEENENLKQIEAVKNGTHPLQQNGNVFDYAYNPDNNKVYKGQTQLQLLTENLMLKDNTNMFTPYSSAIQKNNVIIPGMKPRVTVVQYPEQNGIKVYDILVPSKSFMKKEKAERKLIAKNEINKLKFYEKYGHMPAYPSSLEQIPQLPLTKAENIQNPKPEENLTPSKIIEHDMKQLWISVFTKTPFTPMGNYNNEPLKNELIKFISENSNNMSNIANSTYNNITNQIKDIKSLEHKNQNQENKVEQKTETEHKKVSYSHKRK